VSLKSTPSNWSSTTVTSTRLMMNTQTKAINGLKTISKRLVKKDPATGRREVKILWSTDLEIACDDSDDGAGNLMSWVRRVASDWHGKEYDERV
jgi:hypothetical protein